MVRIFLILIFYSLWMGFVGATTLSAQQKDVAEQVSIELKEGWDPGFTEVVSNRVEAILDSINAYYITETLDLPHGFVNSFGRNQLEELLAGENWFVPMTQITTYIRQSESNKYEVGGLILQNEDDTDYRELVLSFNENAVVTDAELVSGPYNVAPFVGVQAEADAATSEKVMKAVSRLERAFSRQDTEKLSELFASDAQIVSGALLEDEYMRYRVHTASSYLSHLETIFALNEEVSVQFEDPQVLLHPTDSDLYGVRVWQKWNSTRYSDEGALFLVLELEDVGQPQFYLRSWDIRSEAFTPNFYAEVDFSPLKWQALLNRTREVEIALNVESERLLPESPEIQARHVEPSPTDAPRIERRTWYITGGLTAVITSAMLLMAGDGDTDTSIPAPPGRP